MVVVVVYHHSNPPFHFHHTQVRRITFLTTETGQFPKYFTFREKTGYAEDALYRHIDPALAYKLEMFRLKNYDCQHCTTRNPQMHLYHGTSKNKKVCKSWENLMERKKKGEKKRRRKKRENCREAFFFLILTVCTKRTFT